MARLEERFDGVTVAIADLKETVSKLDAHMGAGFAEIRSEFSALRGDVGRELSAIRGEFGGELSAIRREFGSELSAGRAEFGSELSGVRGELSGIRAEMSTQFRWIMGGIGSAALAILVAVLAAALATG